MSCGSSAGSKNILQEIIRRFYVLLPVMSYRLILIICRTYTNKKRVLTFKMKIVIDSEFEISICVNVSTFEF